MGRASHRATVLALTVAAVFWVLAGTARATYVQQGSKLTVSGSNALGQTVAISADGGTALVAENSAASTPGVFVFVKTTSGWMQQAELTGGPEGSGFGSALALSANGNTALLGAPETVSPNPPGEGNYGAAWIYTRSGTTWGSGQEVQPSDESVGTCSKDCSFFGTAVALSGDGTEALVGGPGDTSSDGAAWVYSVSGATATEAKKIVGPSAGAYGGSVGLSSNGQTALISGAGSTALVYTGSGSSWSLQQSLQFPADSGLPERDSTLSGNGATALLGDASNSNGTNDDGLVAVYDRASNNTWSNTATLSNADNTNCSSGTCDAFGSSLSLSADGETSLVGGDDALPGGAAWSFSRSSTSAAWTQSQTLAPNDEDNSSGTGSFGAAVGLSADGSIAVVGGPGDAGGLGAAWVFAAPPSLVVNSVGDAADSNPSGGVCDTGNLTPSGAPECTLRAAIQVANAVGGGTITFDLPFASGPISVTSALPALTAPITIDGLSAAGNPVIQNGGIQTVSGTAGPTGLTLDGTGETLANLTVKGFFDEISLAGGGGDQLYDLTVGPGGASNDLNNCANTFAGRGFGIVSNSGADLIGPGVNVSETGGCDLWLGPDATANRVSGVELGQPDENNPTNEDASGQMFIDGNAETLAGTGNANQMGYLIMTGSRAQVLATRATNVTVIDGSQDTFGDTTSGDTFGCVTLQGGSSNTVADDTIQGGCGVTLVGGSGARITGNQITGNGTPGDPGTGGIVVKHGSTNDMIDSNTIFKNAGSGIVILAGERDRITENSIYDDGELGIDLGGTGRPMELDRVSAASIFGTDGGPNNGLSYPTILRAERTGDKVRLIGGLEGVSGGQTYRIEVFTNGQCGKDGYGEGQHYLGSFDVSTGGFGRITGEAEFDKTLPLPGGSAGEITATTINSDGDTSEFSKCGDTFPGLAANLLGASAATAANSKGIAGILHGGGLTAGGAATGSGTVTVQGSASASAAAAGAATASRAGKLVILTGTLHVKRAGGFVLKLRLTPAGRRLLKRAKKLTITFTASCTVEHHRYSARRGVTLTRKRKH